MHLCVNSCICTTASSHTLSLRQQFGADLLISIATIAHVGGGDIKKIDCHKKKQQCSRKRATVIEVLPKVQRRLWARPWPLAGGLCFIKNKHERTAPAGYQTLSDKDGEISWRDGKEGNDRELLQRALLGFKHLMCCLPSIFFPPISFLHFLVLFSMQKPPLYTPLISPLPPFANTLTPPN